MRGGIFLPSANLGCRLLLFGRYLLATLAVLVGQQLLGWCGQASAAYRTVGLTADSDEMVASSVAFDAQDRSLPELPSDQDPVPSRPVAFFSGDFSGGMSGGSSPTGAGSVVMAAAVDVLQLHDALLVLRLVRGESRLRACHDPGGIFEPPRVYLAA